MFQIQVLHYACSRLLEKYVNFFFLIMYLQIHIVLCFVEILYI